jgi:hypothetical protein
MFLSFLSDGGLFWIVGSGLTVAFMLGMASHGGITGGVLAAVRRWHGSIDDQFSNIDNLVTTVTDHQSVWAMPYEKIFRAIFQGENHP